ncbi:hypothetical protein Syun_019324 [Stephania yunnanensis]|uniref:Uncharacterized protein n=1 Tax=Stephania yunnanensis TaxID=152371 RepID=A0AAP0ITX4_9MAGN
MVQRKVTLVLYNSQHHPILSISTIRRLMTEAMARVRDRVRVPVKCRDRDRGLVRHRDNMFHTDRDFNVLVWECGQPGYITNTCSKQRVGTTDPVAYSCYCRASLTYIDEMRQMMCSLLGGHGGAQLITEEPSLSRRSPACLGGAQLVTEEPSPTEYGDAVSDDRVCLALPRLCDPDPVAPAFGEPQTSSIGKAP